MIRQSLEARELVLLGTAPLEYTRTSRTLELVILKSWSGAILCLSVHLDYEREVGDEVGTMAERERFGILSLHNGYKSVS
jgi:hypothetical protein